MLLIIFSRISGFPDFTGPTFYNNSLYSCKQQTIEEYTCTGCAMLFQARLWLKKYSLKAESKGFLIGSKILKFVN